MFRLLKDNVRFDPNLYSNLNVFQLKTNYPTVTAEIYSPPQEIKKILKAILSNEYKIFVKLDFKPGVLPPVSRFLPSST